MLTIILGGAGMGDLILLDKLESKAKELSSKGDWGEVALKLNKRIIKLKSKNENNEGNDITAHTRLGKCYIELDKIHEAIKIYKQALIIDKTNTIAKNQLDRLLSIVSDRL